MNYFKILSYGVAALKVIEEVGKAMADGKLTTEEGLNIIKEVLEAADIKNVNADLIEIAGLEDLTEISERFQGDQGFAVIFPHAAIEHWTLDL